MSTLLQSTGVTFPSAVQGFEKDTHTPTAYQFSAGIQRDIGWDTVVDAAYVGSRVRNLLQTRNINLVPYGARFDPANQDPTRPGNPLPDNFFRPYPGYSDINFFENSGISNYDALQVQINRRFSRGLQFGLAYTFSHSKDYTSAADTGTGANMSGTSYGACVLHVAPESFVGGPLAFVRDGDIIELDVPGRRLTLRIDDDELSQRRAAWTRPQPLYPRGFGHLYAQHVTQANRGCDFDFLEGTEPISEPEIH